MVGGEVSRVSQDSSYSRRSELKAAVALVAGGLELRPIDEPLEIADGLRLAATELSSQRHAPQGRLCKKSTPPHEDSSIGRDIVMDLTYSYIYHWYALTVPGDDSSHVCPPTTPVLRLSAGGEGGRNACHNIDIQS